MIIVRILLLVTIIPLAASVLVLWYSFSTNRSSSLPSSAQQHEVRWQFARLKCMCKSSGDCMLAYLETLNQYFLSRQTADSRDASEILKKLRSRANLTLQILETLRLEEQLLSMDRRVLAEYKISDHPQDSIDSWRIIRNDIQRQIDQLSEVEPALTPNSEDTSTKAALYLLTTVVILSSLLQAGLVRWRVIKPFERLMEANSEILTAHHLQIPPGSKSDPLRHLAASTKLIGDALQSVKQHEVAMIKHAVDLICWLDQSGRFQKVSPACESITGYTEQELYGTALSNYIVSNEAGAVATALQEASGSVDFRTFENWFRTKAGSQICLRWSAHWSKSDNALFCIAHNVTDVKIAETLLKDKEAELRLLMERMPASLMATDADGTIKRLNVATTALLEISTDEIIERNIIEFFRDPSNAQCSLQKLSEQGGLLRPSALDTIPVAGDARRVEMTLDKLPGERNAYVAIAIDVSERHKWSQLRERLTAMLTHDMATPLTNVLLLISKLTTEEQKNLNGSNFKVALTIKSQIERLKRMFEELLSLSKTIVDEQPLKPESIGLKKLLRECVNEVSAIADQRGVILVLESDDSQIFVDVDRFSRVVTNLLGNALKFSPEQSQITIKGLEKENAFEVSVQDQGPGIPENLLTAIFQPYKQAHAADARTGTGLGLAISAKIVEMHGGTIKAFNNPTGGATFIVRVPTTAVESGSVDKD